MTLNGWLIEAEKTLFDAGVEEPHIEARLLAAHALERSKAWVLAHGPDLLSEGEIARLGAWRARRAAREPLAHLTGVREFYGRPFRVTPATLVPRPETETLVDLALDLAPKGAKVLDVGTGTGCIGITLALERPDLEVTLLDLSEEALEVAQENAQNLHARVETIQSDLYATFRHPKPTFDLIVSNPPYIRADAPLMPEVARFEPPSALYAGKDGLDFYRRLSEESVAFLKPNGTLAVEIGYDQSESVPRLFEKQGWRTVEARKDLAGFLRALAFTRSPYGSVLRPGSGQRV